MPHLHTEMLRMKMLERRHGKTRRTLHRSWTRSNNPEGCLAAFFLLTGFATFAMGWIISALLSLAVPTAVVAAAAAVAYYFLTGEFPLAR